ncbi:MAG: dihydrolipoamide acetyltransferase family protein [Acidimicrobiales bacterium]
MSLQVVKVPDVGEGVAEVELVSWSVAPGDRVTRNQILAEVMSDKVNVEIPAPVAGRIVATHGHIGDVLAVGNPLLELESDGAAPGPGSDPPPPAAVSPPPHPVSAPAPAVSLPAPVVSPPAPAGPAAPFPRLGPVAPARSSSSSSLPSGSGPVRSVPSERRPRAAPAVRARARTAGIDLAVVAGSGPAGRITHDDLDAHLAAVGPGAPAPAAGLRPPDDRIDDVPIVGLRRQIARNLVASTTTIPHITYVDEVDVTELDALRRQLNDSRPEGRTHLTVLPFLIRALVVVLPEFPDINAHVLGDGDPAGEILRRFGGVHVGVATQTDGGLVVSVIRHAEADTVWTCAARIAELTAAARAGTAGREELSGSTITVTSLGPLGGLVTTPVINRPEVAIVGVNRMVVRPVWRDGAFIPRTMMNLSSSFDHRVIDGWQAANFVQAVKRCLEHPALLFVDRP